MSYSLKFALISIILIFSEVHSSNNFFRTLQPGGEPGGQPGSDSSSTSVTYTAEYTYSSTNCLASSQVSSDDADEKCYFSSKWCNT